jgi:hypothetical protein
MGFGGAAAALIWAHRARLADVSSVGVWDLATIAYLLASAAAAFTLPTGGAAKAPTADKRK